MNPCMAFVWIDGLLGIPIKALNGSGFIFEGKILSLLQKIAH